jgi:hypothetical protein
MRSWALWLCVWVTGLLVQPTFAQSSVGLRPYTARYTVSYRGLDGGDIEFRLERLDNDQYKFSSHLFPSFLGSFFASDQAEDSTVFELTRGEIRPLHFRSEDGTSDTKKDIRMDFGWNRNKVTGRVGDTDFEVNVPAGAQDRMSIQLAASLALQAGREPGQLVLVEKNETQEYTIKQQGMERTRVPAGEYDTIVLNSQRTGSSRATRYWYAPQLNYLPARAERTSKGKVDIVMKLKSFKFND